MRCPFALSVVVALSFAATASAQQAALLLPVVVAQDADDAASDPVTREDHDRAISQLKTQIDDLTRRLEGVSENSSANSVRIGQLSNRLDTELQTVQDNVTNLLERQGEILRAISRQDDQGNYLPRLAGNMQNPSFANEMRDVVNQSIPRRGTLRIVNRTSQDQQIWVNERDGHVIPAQSAKEIVVSAGTVTTKIPGQRMMTWTVGPPQNQQVIEIIQRETARPVSSVYWNAPIYVPGVDYIVPQVVYPGW